MSLTLDILSPQTVGEDMIVLTPKDTRTKYAHRMFAVNVDYSRTAPHGTKIPIEVYFQSPDLTFFYYRVFYTLPKTLTLLPRMGGDHLLLVREMFHYEWQGRLIIPVLGDELRIGVRQ